LDHVAIHLPRLIGEDPDIANLACCVFDVVRAVVDGDTEQHDETAIDGTGNPSVDGHRRTGHALDDGPHQDRWNVIGTATVSSGSVRSIGSIGSAMGYSRLSSRWRGCTLDSALIIE